MCILHSPLQRSYLKCIFCFLTLFTKDLPFVIQVFYIIMYCTNINQLGQFTYQEFSTILDYTVSNL